MATANPYASYQNSYFDVEKGHDEVVERTLRQGFVKKVFGLLATQLALTTLIAGSIVFAAPVRAFVESNPAVLSVAALVSIAIVLGFSFSPSARQSHPLNLVLLFAFTAAEGVLVGAVSCQAATDVVVLAFGITAGVTVGLALYALTTKRDFTAAGALLFTCLLSLLLAGFVGLFVRTSALNLLLGGAGAVLFSCYIVYDVQMLLGGSHKFSVSPDEYVFGAIAIYLDIINLFLHILRMLNASRD